MVRVVHLSPQFAVAGQLSAVDFADLAAQGFKSVVCNRPDGEDPTQISAAEAQASATAAGLAFKHFPLRMPEVLDPATADATKAMLDTLPGPILAFCRSGTRSAIAWAAAAVQVAPADDVIDALQQADFVIPGLADELRARAAERS